MDKVIEIKNLKKYFGEVKAVDDISFSVKEGQLFAFLGLNGAGKSTTINIIVGILKKDSGECIVNSKSVDDIEKILPEIGIVFQSSVLDNKLTVLENLRYRAALYGIMKEEFDKNLNFLTEALDMKNILKKTFEKLSGGQKRKADIARALIHKPKLLILDEPTTGLDPQTRKLVWTLISQLRKSDRLTVLLTTHYMEEASEADYVAIMESGKIVATGTPTQLKNEYASDFMKIYGYDYKLIEVLKSHDLKYIKNREFIQIEFKDTLSAKNFLMENEKMITDFEVIKGKMDDVFLNVTGRDIKELR